MRPSERSLLLTGTAVALVASVVAAVALDNVRGFYFPFSEGVLAVVFAGAGSIVARSMPSHAVGRLMLWMGFVGALAQLAAAFDPTVIEDPTVVETPAGLVAGLLRFSIVLMLLALVARFPDGGWTTPWARRLFYVDLVAVLSFIGLSAGGASGVLPISEEQALLPFLLVPPVSGALAIIVVVHLLRSDPVRRRQVGWVLLVLGLASLQEAVIEGLGLEFGRFEGVVRGVVVALLPISIVVAVTRYRLYEIDRVISRTISYGLVLGAMGAVYVAVFLGLGSLLDLGGDTEVALATLAAVAVSVPLLRWASPR